MWLGCDWELCWWYGNFFWCVIMLGGWCWFGVVVLFYWLCVCWYRVCFGLWSYWDCWLLDVFFWLWLLEFLLLCVCSLRRWVWFFFVFWYKCIFCLWCVYILIILDKRDRCDVGLLCWYFCWRVWEIVFFDCWWYLLLSCRVWWYWSWKDCCGCKWLLVELGWLCDLLLCRWFWGCFGIF